MMAQTREIASSAAGVLERAAEYCEGGWTQGAPARSDSGDRGQHAL